MKLINLKLTIWGEGSALKGMREVSTDQFNYTELVKGVAGYQGFDDPENELSNFIRLECEKLLDSVESMYETIDAHSFLKTSKEDKSYYGKNISDLTEDQQTNLFRDLNGLLLTDKITINSEDDVMYVLNSKTLNLPPIAYVALTDRLRSMGLIYKFK